MRDAIASFTFSSDKSATVLLLSKPGFVLYLSLGAVQQRRISLINQPS
jgi:hypothetical protein